MTRICRSGLTLAALSILTSGEPLQAQSERYSLQRVLSFGDIVPGTNHRIDAFLDLDVQDGGHWLAVVSTYDDVLSAPGPDTAMVDGLPVAAEGDPLPAPTFGTIGSLLPGLIEMEQGSNVLTMLTLSGVAVPNTRGLSRNKNLLVRYGQACLAPVFTVPTQYTDVRSGRISPSGMHVAFTSWTDALTGGALAKCVLQATLSPTGQLLTENVVARQFTPAPGLTRNLQGFPESMLTSAVNDSGDVMWIGDLFGDPQTDGVLYLNSTLLAQEGDPSPLPGRNWRNIHDGSQLGLNDSGDWFFVGSLDNGPINDVHLAVKNGAVFLVPQQTLPAIAPYPLATWPDRFELAETGDVFWSANIQDVPNGGQTSSCVFRNYDVLFRSHHTVFEGQPLDSVRLAAASPDGEWLLLRGLIQNSTFLMLAQREGTTNFAYCSPGTSANGCSPTISAIGAPSASGSSNFTLQVAGVDGQCLGKLLVSFTGPSSLAYPGLGTLCVRPPFLIAAKQFASGNLGQCDGALSFDWTSFMSVHPQLLNPAWSFGREIWAQAVVFPSAQVRKPLVLSDAFDFVLTP